MCIPSFPNRSAEVKDSLITADKFVSFATNRKNKQPAQNQQVLAARNFVPNQSLKTMAYFVYFEFFKLQSWGKRAADNRR